VTTLLGSLSILSDPQGLIIILAGLFLGAVLKGATGAGLPIIAIPTIAIPTIAIPTIAAFYDVRVAVVRLVIPNFITNAWQIIMYREHDLTNNFATHFALAGIVGAGFGTLLLASLPLLLLNIVIAVVVIIYIIIRIRQPTFKLPMAVMHKWKWIAGLGAGVLQGAVGLSSPITITFLHTGSFPRLTFIYVASLFFAGMSIIQVPMQLALGLMTSELAILSMLTLIPIALGLPLGARIGKKLSPKLFDQLILILLAAVAIKMLIDAFLQL